ncbi:MAG: hypothetical protein ABSA77_10790, partial [Thermoguttaceae bacterium]
MFGKSCVTWCAALAFLLLPAALITAEELKLDHVLLSYSGISKANAVAIGRTVARARNVAVEQFGFDMPETINVEINVDP